MEQAIVTRLDNMRQEGGESLKSDFTRFSVKLIVCETISDEKARDAL